MTAISDLDIFARVARTGNMSAAGREMGLSPALVSKRISLLEERLGARLFQRTTRQLTLTETGEGYFKRVTDILNLVEEAEDFVNRGNARPRGVLKVSAPTSFSRRHLMPGLREFLGRFPDIVLDLQASDGFVDIIKDGFDVAIRIGELQDSTLFARKLASETRVLCAAPDYLSQAGHPARVEDLESRNCICVGGQEVWRLESQLESQQIRINGNLKTNSAEIAREAVLAGLGIGLRPIWDIMDELAQGRLRIVLPDWRGASNQAIYAVYPCRDYMPEKVNVFIEFLAARFATEQAWCSAERWVKAATVKNQGAEVTEPRGARRVAR
jgi:DNA-binding transcriptional LysR family regulator